MNVKYPFIFVDIDEDMPNAFEIIANVRAAMKEHGIPKAERDAFRDACLNSHSYDKLRRIALETVQITGPDWSHLCD